MLRSIDPGHYPVQVQRQQPSPEVRDRGIRALLRLRVRNFEARFAKAVDTVTRRRDSRKALAELERFRGLEPGFWLATFYAAVAQRRLGAH